jgi:hypothetical protein
MAQTRSMTSVKRVRDAMPPRKIPSTTVMREPYELRPRAKTTIVVTIPQTPYNLRPRIHVA